MAYSWKREAQYRDASLAPLRLSRQTPHAMTRATKDERRGTTYESLWPIAHGGCQMEGDGWRRAGIRPPGPWP